MAVFSEHIGINVEAKEDLDSHIYFAVSCQDGKIANNGAEASGILMTKPKNGESGNLGCVGELPFQAGGAVSAGAKITVTTSGYCTAAGSGDHIVGKNGQASVTSGSIGRGLFNFNNPVYAFSSSHVA